MMSTSDLDVPNAPQRKMDEVVEVTSVDAPKCESVDYDDVSSIISFDDGIPVKIVDLSNGSTPDADDKIVTHVLPSPIPFKLHSVFDSGGSGILGMSAIERCNRFYNRISGPLNRRSGVFKNFKESYFELEDHVLRFYDVDKAGNKDAERLKGWFRVLGWRCERVDTTCIAIYNPAFHGVSPVTKQPISALPWDMLDGERSEAFDELPGYMQTYLETCRYKPQCAKNTPSLLYIQAATESIADEWMVALEKESCNCDALNGCSMPISNDIQMELPMLMKLCEDFFEMMNSQDKNVLLKRRVPYGFVHRSLIAKYLAECGYSATKLSAEAFEAFLSLLVMSYDSSGSWFDVVQFLSTYAVILSLDSSYDTLQRVLALHLGASDVVTYADVLSFFQSLHALAWSTTVRRSTAVNSTMMCDAQFISSSNSDDDGNLYSRHVTIPMPVGVLFGELQSHMRGLQHTASFIFGVDKNGEVRRSMKVSDFMNAFNVEPELLVCLHPVYVLFGKDK